MDVEQLLFQKNQSILEFHSSVIPDKTKLGLRAAYFCGEVASYYNDRGEIARSAITLAVQSTLYNEVGRIEMASSALDEAISRIKDVESLAEMTKSFKVMKESIPCKN